MPPIPGTNEDVSASSPESRPREQTRYTEAQMVDTLGRIPYPPSS